MTRFGIGYDIHELREGRPFVLAGIVVPCPFGPFGHSDGDPLCHAIADAALGAAALGDIGVYFPDTEPAFRGMPGLEILRKTREILSRSNCFFRQLDSLVICQEPALSRWRGDIVKAVSNALDLAPENTGLKFRTNEKMDAVGRGEAIAAYAVVNLEKQP